MTHHLPPKEVHLVEAAQGGGGGLRISEHDVCLAAHLQCFEHDDVEDGAVGGEQKVEAATEVFLLEPVLEVRDIEAAVTCQSCGAEGGKV
jgi:hypothetical protein